MTPRRWAASLLVTATLLVGCSSDDSGGPAATGDVPATDGSELADGEVVTRNPSQSDESAAADPDVGDGAASGSDGSSTGSSESDDPGAPDIDPGDGGDFGETGSTTGGASTGGGDDDFDPLPDDAIDIPPEDIESLTDDSALILVDVPNVWADVDGSPNGDRRRLVASTDLAAFGSGYAVPGLALEALEVESGAADWESDYAAFVAEAEADGCSLDVERPYDDGVYFGTERQYSCAGSDLDVSLIGGTNEDQSTSWLLRLITPSGDDSTRQLVFQSFLVD